MAPQMSTDENDRALLLEAHARFLRLYEATKVERKPPSRGPEPEQHCALVVLRRSA